MAAARGFAVFYPNYRGSTGRGVEFSKLSQGDPAGKEFDDLVDAVDHLVAAGLVDQDKVGVTGGSYGGYATAWCATRYTDRFAAGVMFVGISDKISKVGTTDIPDEEFYVHALHRPWENWQFFLERSPIYHADGAGRRCSSCTARTTRASTRASRASSTATSSCAARRRCGWCSTPAKATATARPPRASTTTCA